MNVEVLVSTIGLSYDYKIETEMQTTKHAKK